RQPHRPARPVHARRIVLGAAAEGGFAPMQLLAVSAEAETAFQGVPVLWVDKVRIESVQVGLPRNAGEMRTAFGKRSVAGPVRAGRTNLEGDEQADRRYHGGPDMAVLAYAADHYPAWRAELSWPELPLGGFGENLSVSGATEETVCIGDVWRAGSAVFQIASPRKPCHKISDYWGRPDLLERVLLSE